MTKYGSSEPSETLISKVSDVEARRNDARDFLDDVAQLTEARTNVEGIVVGTLTGLDEAGVPLVDFSLNPTGRPISARSTVALNEDHRGCNVALMFEQNNVRQPIVIGLMHVPGKKMAVTVDGEIQEVVAEKELLLRCGKSSILLRRDGKIIIKGENILSRARMTNKVKGGSIQLN